MVTDKQQGTNQGDSPSGILGFRNLDSDSEVIAQCLESLALDDLGQTPSPEAMALAVTGHSLTDEQILQLAEDLPAGQSLWAFSPTSRRIRCDRLKLTHVPSGTDREFLLKVAGHIERFVKSQPSGSPLNPQRSPFPEIHRDYGSIAAYRPVLDVRHTVAIKESDVRFDLFSDLRSDSTKLVVFGQDAMSRSSVTLPHFFRWKWADNVKSSVLILNDPTLYLNENLNAGWWVGTPSRDYVHDAVNIVRRAIHELGITATDVLFFGASAGGFSSLHMASALKGSSALVDIPQTDLRTYSEVKEANNAVQAGLGIESTTDLPDELLHRVDAVERFRFEDNVPAFRYFQNNQDATHVVAQMEHFQKRLPPSSSSPQDFEMYSQWHLIKGGHFPLKESSMVSAINSMLDSL